MASRIRKAGSLPGSVLERLPAGMRAGIEKWGYFVTPAIDPGDGRHLGGNDYVLVEDEAGPYEVRDPSVEGYVTVPVRCYSTNSSGDVRWEVGPNLYGGGWERSLVEEVFSLRKVS
jgi:hypothetical protein